MKQLAIFDLDGTLLNTISDLGAAVNHALKAHGFASHSLSSYTSMVGNGVRKLIERALPDDARNEDTISALLIDFKSFYNDNCTIHTVPYEGIRELLVELQNKRVRIAVASNKYQYATEKIVTHYFNDIDFIAIEGQKEGIPVKPDPSIVFNILAKAEICKCDTIYIGDSGVDMETARRACIESLGVTWGFRSEKELKEHCADNIVHHPDEILPYINKMR